MGVLRQQSVIDRDRMRTIAVVLTTLLLLVSGQDDQESGKGRGLLSNENTAAVTAGALGLGIGVVGSVLVGKLIEEATDCQPGEVGKLIPDILGIRREKCGGGRYQGQYLSPNTQLQVPSNQYQGASNQYHTQDNKYQTPSNQYQGVTSQYQTHNDQYQSPSSEYQTHNNQYQVSTINQYQTPSNKYQTQFITNQYAPKQQDQESVSGGHFKEPEHFHPSSQYNQAINHHSSSVQYHASPQH